MERKEIVNISDYYLMKAELDKKAVKILAAQGLYSQAIYFELQYMEKFIKSEICKKINIENKYTHELVNKHSIKELIFFLIDIIAVNETFNIQLKSQIEEILGRIDYNKLYNNLRYPYYSPKNKIFVHVEYNKKDYEQIVNESFKQLKNYISNLYKISM